jgi:hypothetical protein
MSFLSVGEVRWAPSWQAESVSGGHTHAGDDRAASDYPSRFRRSTTLLVHSSRHLIPTPSQAFTTPSPVPRFEPSQHHFRPMFTGPSWRPSGVRVDLYPRFASARAMQEVVTGSRVVG